jgi:hypothetical protein
MMSAWNMFRTYPRWTAVVFLNLHNSHPVEQKGELKLQRCAQIQKNRERNTRAQRPGTAFNYKILRAL